MSSAKRFAAVSAVCAGGWQTWATVRCNTTAAVTGVVDQVRQGERPNRNRNRNRNRVWVIFLGFVRLPARTMRHTPMGRTRGEPNDTKLAATNGSVTFFLTKLYFHFRGGAGEGGVVNFNFWRFEGECCGACCGGIPSCRGPKHPHRHSGRRAVNLTLLSSVARDCES